MRIVIRYCVLLALLLTGLLGIEACRRSADPQPVISSLTVPTVTLAGTGQVRLAATLAEGPANASVTVGFVWSKTNPLPTLADARFAQSAIIAALPLSFSTIANEFLTNGTYYVRAFVTTPDTKTTYSPVNTFPLTLTVSDVLARVLTDSLSGRDIGYGFAIYDGATLKASGSGGLKSRPVDAEGSQPYTIDTKMHIASMSKTIATMAFLQLARQKGIRTTDRIRAYLPASWPKGPNIDQITFKDLLTHRSGLVGLGSDRCVNGAYGENIYAGLKQLIAKGVKTTDRGQYCYQNANMGLFRVLIPALTEYAFTGDDATDDQQTQQRYQQYVQANIFAKVGLSTTLATFPTGNPTYTYTYPYGGQTGWNPGNLTATVGGYGWYMTTRDAGTLFARVMSSPDESVLTTAYKDTLLLNNLGCFRASTSYGSLAYHDGWWYISSPNRGLRTIWMKLPDNQTIVLFVNALSSKTAYFPSNDGTDIVPFVFRAYGQARQRVNGRLAAPTLVLEHPEPH